MADIKQRAHMTNTQIGNDAKLRNMMQGDREVDANQANIAKARDFKNAAISGIGTKAALGKHNQKQFDVDQEYNERLLNTLNSMGFSFMIDDDNKISYITYG